MPKKTVGEIGPFRITGGEAGAERIKADLPTDKEELEQFFAGRFSDAFNRQRTMPGVEITNLRQQDTSDLDFRIDCSRATYLELAELTPLSEAFGRAGRASGSFNTLEYATWIYEQVIKAKSDKYGETSRETFLLLYPKHSQFVPGQTLLQCLRSLCFWRGSKFAAIFTFTTSGGAPDQAIEIITRITPISPPWPPKPDVFKDHQFWNLMDMAQITETGVSVAMSALDLPTNPR